MSTTTTHYVSCPAHCGARIPVEVERNEFSNVAWVAEKVCHTCSADWTDSERFEMECEALDMNFELYPKPLDEPDSDR